MKIFFSALEVSADLHGSKLINALKQKQKNIYFFGLGGERMKEEGLDVRWDLTRYSTVGFVEPLPYIPKLLKIQQEAKNLLREARPDLAIFIDAQGFNLPLAKYAKSLGIITVYYFAPQYWLWGKKEEAKEVLSNLDWIIATFPQEYSLYKSFGDNVVFFGHPLIDYLSVYSNIDKKNDLIGLFPGSRVQEIKKLTPIFLEIAEKLPGYKFVIPLASQNFSNLLYSIIKGKENLVKVVSGNESQKILRASVISLVASGTVTLEAAILKTPVFVFYKISPLTYFIAKRLVHYPYIALPNIILEKRIFPEYVQYIDINKVVKDIDDFLKDSDRREKMLKDLDRISEIIGKPGVLDKISDFILNLL
uniref:Lipid-A-disaccharide synthase n=1 Tax=Dictyoglomus thermophilum TaxID=14 RepID=A0A7C3MS69_DICTH